MQKLKNIDWITSLFLVLTPIAAAVLIPMYVHSEGWHWSLLLMVAGFWLLTGMSITAGYHRCLSHRSYEASRLMKLMYLLFGAAAFQGSALKWCSDHRRHHRFVDTDNDPYSIKKGFWYAHIGWLFLKDDPEFRGDFAPDLKNDPLIFWQHKYYGLISIVMGFGTPVLVGSLFGMPWGGFVFGGLARIVVGHHCTFFINSLCHTLGNQPYSDKHSARDSFVMALVTFGEGYHNFHHEFQIDYRNGVRWYQWDPTKWVIQSAALMGLARKLRKVSPEAMVRARVLQDEKRIVARGISHQRIEELKEKVLAAQEDFRRRAIEWKEYRTELKAQSSEKFLQMKADLRVTKMEFKKSYAQWKAYVKIVSNVST